MVISKINSIKNIFRKSYSKKILISFCNLPEPRKSGLLLYDLDRAAGDWIDLGFEGCLVNSCTGLWQDNEFIFSLFSGKGFFHISVIGKKDLKPILCRPLKEVKDGHSISFFKNHLLVVSTGTDEVIKYEFTGNEFQKPEVFWSASKAKMDTHHLNSILSLRDGIYVSGFGVKKSQLWSDATHGYIYKISANRLVKGDIFHPHTLTETRGRLYYCESVRQAFCDLDGTVKLTMEGYTRGACFLDRDTVVVGTSIGRKVSKSTGIISNPADPGETSGKSAIYIHKLKKGARAMVDMSGFGPEIYDINLY